jgi:hypothetical protein
MKDAIVIPRIEVDVIIPVFNAAEFLRDAVASAMHQTWAVPIENHPPPEISVHVCCYNDGSTDESWRILQELLTEYNNNLRRDDTDDPPNTKTVVENPSKAARWPIPSQLYIETGSQSRGAGYARNRAVAMRVSTSSTNAEDDDDDNVWRFLCWLDSDDIMDESRICHQIQEFMNMLSDDRETILLGCLFDRIPVGSTWHYTQWANTLDDERIYLERFREVTLLQPTWMMSRKRFEQLGGYLEAPPPATLPATVGFNVFEWLQHSDDKQAWRLVHRCDTAITLRLAEDLRFFHEHLAQNGKLRRCPTGHPLVTYRHHSASSQSSQTPRKLLLSLRVAAMEKSVLQQDRWQQFLIWGAGRDGKDFVKALSPHIRSRVYCFLEVDDQKIARGFYQYRHRVNDDDLKERNDVDIDIPILHFSLAALDQQVRNSLYNSWKNGSASLGNDNTSATLVTEVAGEKDYMASSAFGQIDKKKCNESIKMNPPPTKRSKTVKTKCDKLPRQDPGRSVIDVGKVAQLPVVVCVALNRTNGALEHNVRLIDRTEGHDLWHFS